MTGATSGAPVADQTFDHFSTGFPLIGAHRTVPCETCHARGAFKGTPSRCAACHDGLVAVGKTDDHVATSAACDACHSPSSTTFDIAGPFDHLEIRNGCNNCHLQDLPTSHIPRPAGAECNLCHRVPPDNFANAAVFNHNNVTAMRCDACHSGTFNAAGAAGKSPNHPPTSPGQDCHVCHDTNSFTGGGFDHSAVTSGCDACHAKDKPATHIPTPSGAECILCHRVAPDTFAQAAMFNHGNVRSLRCDACHNGNFTPFGAPGKIATHPPTKPAQDCVDCHSTTTFTAAAFDHAGTTSGCAACHTSDLPTAHIPRPAGADCVLCHRVPPPDDFSIAASFNHSNVTALRCDACHSGAFLSAGAITKSPTHPTTPPGQDCNVCHKSATTFADVTFDHTGVTNGCNNCHASDKPANHIPVPPGSECVVCHRVPPDTFAAAATFNHALVSAMRCDTCHSGAFIAAGAPGKGTSHLPIVTGQDCAICHRSPPDVFTSAAAFAHSSVATLRCDACHNGAFTGAGAPGKTPTHPSTAAGQDCNVCHLNTVSFADVAFNHAGVTTGCNNCHLTDKPANHLPVPVGAECVLCHRIPPDPFTVAGTFSHVNVTSQRCDACHSGAFAAAGALGKTPDHPATAAGQDCNACHLNTTSFAGAAFNHTGISTGCNGCHLADKSANHIPVPAGAECFLCHRVPPDPFTVAATFNHSKVTAMRCDACHSGAFTGAGATGKTPDHPPIAAGQDCNACHLNTTSFAGAAFNHTGITTGCNSCHLADKPASHIPVPASAECFLCHRVPPDPFTIAATFNHNKVTAMRCDACHSGAFAGAGALGKTPNHPATTAGQDCNVCHLNTTSFAGAAFNHTGVTTGCNSCHLADKPASHIPVPASAECFLCHRVPPDPFTIAATFNHNKVTAMRCDACHSGAFAGFGALGKTPNHPATAAGQDCNVCHLNTTSFAGAAFNHAGVTTGCNSCHLADKPASHIPVPASAECFLCHRVPPDPFTIAATFNHNKVTAMRCDACHSGAFAGSGAVGKTPNHPPIAAGQDCNTCHLNTTSFAGAAFNHAGVTTGCNSCHLADKPASHIPVPASGECFLCHRVPPDPFTIAATFNHNKVTAMRCDACHSGAFAGSGAVGKTPTHPATTAGQDCNVCHLNTTSFAGAAFNHAGVTTGCNSCHLADKPASHIPVPASAECFLCHRVPPDPFTIAATFNHNKVTAMRCDACHSGAFAGAGAVGKTPNHPATTAGQDCNACHLNTTSFAGAAFNHAGVTTGCNSCHLADKPANHLPVPAGAECFLCHRVPPDPFTTAATFSHSKVTAMRCDTCHSGAFRSYGAQGKPGDHPRVAAGLDCNASGCHNTNGW